MKISFSSLFHRKKDLAGPSDGSTKPQLQAPDGMSCAETRAWKARAGEAAHLLQQLDARTKDCNGVNSEHLHLKSLIPPGKPFGSAQRPIRAHLMPGTGNLLMDAPIRKEAHSWAASCIDHRIARVIDLRPPGADGEPSCMDSGKVYQSAPGGVAARFRGINLHGPRSKKPVAQAIKSVGGQVTNTWMEVTLTHLGRPYRPEGASEGGCQRLDWCRVPVKRGNTMSSAQLFALCEHVGSRRIEPGERQAIQCPAHDRHAGALVEAALLLRQWHRSGIDVTGDRSRAVLDACSQVREHGGPELFRQADLTSLLEYCDRLQVVPRDAASLNR